MSAFSCKNSPFLAKIVSSLFTSTINKPAYTGVCILELTKVLIYEFHYDSIKNKYDKKSILFINS